MERWAGRVALVTGASVGIGAALVRKLVKHGVKVVGCARSVDKIQELATELQNEKGSLTAVKCDLKNESEIDNLFKLIQKDFGRLDICVNNAGFAYNSPMLTGNTDDWRQMLDVNCLALCICSRESYKLMKENGIDDGHIVLVNSMSGHRIVNVKASHFYSATKFFVTAATESLRQELREEKSNIRVTSVSPGLVYTEFQGRMFNDMDKGKEICTSIKTLEADDIADSIIYALSAPAHAEVNEIKIRPTEQAS